MFSSKQEFYFAYGSNMSSRRLAARIASARLIGPARLDGFRWCCNKLGGDGTAKANLIQQEQDSVLGVLFTIKSRHLNKLDKIENGYRRIEVEVQQDTETITACTYISELLTHQPPSEAYIGHIIDGLIEHELPAAYVRQVRLEAGI